MAENTNIPDKTVDTGFSEAIKTPDETISELGMHAEKPNGEQRMQRLRTMTKKGYEFMYAIKEKGGRTSNKAFLEHLNSFNIFIALTSESDKIQAELAALRSHADTATTEIEEWLKFTFDETQRALITDLILTINNALESAQKAGFEKLRNLGTEEATSVTTTKSRASSRKSNKSKTTSGSTASKSSRRSLITVQAKRVALEQQLKYSDAIQEQQKVLARLQLEQELSAAKAEEAVYQAAIDPEEFQVIENGLPTESENMINRFICEQSQINLAETPLHSQNPESPVVFMAMPTTATGSPAARQNPVPSPRQTVSLSPRPLTHLVTGSTPVTSQLPVVPHTSVTFVTPHRTTTWASVESPAAPAVKTPLRPETDPFIPSPQATVYNDILPNSATRHNTGYTPKPTSTANEFVEALAMVTQLQRLPQAKPDVFRGDEKDTKFFIWETAFDALIDSAPISAQQKPYLLYQHLDGKAKRTVEQLQYMVSLNPEIAYQEARKKLKQRFGRSAIIATDFENKLTNWARIGSNDAQGIREFSDFLQQVEIASTHLPSLKIFEYPSKIQTLVEKLPGWFTTKWSTLVQTFQQQAGYDSFPSFSDFVREVTFHADRMNIPQICRQTTSSTGRSAANSITQPAQPVKSVISSRRQQGVTTLASTTKIKTPPSKSMSAGDRRIETASKDQCLYHKTKTHNLKECKKFRELSIDERKDFFKKHKLCFKCAAQNKHLAESCSEESPDCDICHKEHLTILHNESKPIPFDILSACTQVCGKEGSGRSCARIVLVSITHQAKPENEITTYAVLDDQSTDVFITDSLISKLDVTAQELDLKVNTIVGSNTIRSKKVAGLFIQDTDHQYAKMRIPYAYSREYIPATHQDIATPQIVRQWKHLAEIADKIPVKQDVEIGLLIGRNVPAAFQPIGVISGGAEEPWAEQYKFGWTVIGRVCKDPGGLDMQRVYVNRVTVERETYFGRNPCSSSLSSSRRPFITYPFVEPVLTKDITTPKQVREMMELDYSELRHCRKVRGTEQAESIEDKRFREIISKGIHKNSDGNWEIPLPFKTDEISLPNNKQHCLKRLLSLKRKLLGDEKLKSDYLAFMQKTLDRSHASRVPVDQLRTSPGNVWYLPHFSVYHPRKPNQIRVVFDCSAVYANESLNKHLLQGPDQLNSLIGVLTRFRKEEVAFTCDIEQMFHSFYVTPEHRDFLRFLWFENNDLNGPIIEYRMDVHLFGAASSPGVANFCLHHTATTNRKQFGDDAADFLLRDFYVDDGLKSLPTIKEAVQLIKDCQAMCANDNLRLHKFASNKKGVLEALPAEDRTKDLKDLDLRHDTMPIQRSLGTYWCIESDTLGFRIELRDKPLTRRGILSTVSSVYDPLGAVSPVILRGKQILQELCRQHAEWDEPLPEEFRPRWEKWRLELPLLEKLTFPRCLKPPNFGTPTCTEIFSFSDASDTGIGQVSYLRMVNEKQEIHVSFLMAKSRVAPLKPIFIPRLELTAAVISVNVTSMLEAELDIKDTSCLYFTDSEIVIGYINNEARRFHVYVGNRVQHIRDRSDPKRWFHVPGKENLADEASRGATAKELQENKRWFSGPQFLLEQDPLSFLEEPSCALNPTDVEVRKESCVLTTDARQVFPDYLEPSRFKHSSSLHRMKHTVVRIQRMIKRLRPNKEYNWRPTEGPSLTKELREAERTIVKAAQYDSFQKEVKTLRSLQGNDIMFKNHKDAHERKATMKRTTNLYKLDPFIDDEGLMRIGGRLTNADAPIRHPIILPRNGHVTTLLIRHYHNEKQHHQGYGITHNAIRQAGFYIINGRSVISNVVSKCVTCRRLRGRAQEQKMADLPRERVTPSAPFTYTGMDVFGPFYIKEGRRELKRWGLMLTCLASRAVHIEVLNTMSTDSFINALRRFIARRGKVRELRSDQGTNFVGAKNELSPTTKDLNKEAIQKFLSSQDCDFVELNFNVPHASHMGGVWERQIRTTRSVLNSLLQEHGRQLDDEALRTLMAEAENIVNSRPLTVESLSEHLAAEPLTPNHLLTLKTQVVLPPPGQFDPPDAYSRKRWRRVQYLANQFWLRWQKEYCALLYRRQKWNKTNRNMQVGDIVVICEESPRNQWPLALVSAVYPNKDNLVRKVQLVTSRNGERKTFDRPVQKLILLLA